MNIFYCYVAILGVLCYASADPDEDGGNQTPSDESEYETIDMRSKCENALQQCDAVANPVVCCMVKPLANASCQRACKFCHDMNSVPGLGSMPGGGGIPVPGAPSPPSPTVQNDPCNPGSAPGISGGNQGGGGVPPPGLG